MTQPQAEFLDLYRAGLKTSADLMKASLQNAERLQNQQLSAIRTALEQQSKSINELGQARTIDELVTRTRPPHSQGHPVRFYYATQVAVRPPTIVACALSTGMRTGRPWWSAPSR